LKRAYTGNVAVPEQISSTESVLPIFRILLARIMSEVCVLMSKKEFSYKTTSLSSSVSNLSMKLTTVSHKPLSVLERTSDTLADKLAVSKNALRDSELADLSSCNTDNAYAVAITAHPEKAIFERYASPSSYEIS
jgi:hypothetical protein